LAKKDTYQSSEEDNDKPVSNKVKVPYKDKASQLSISVCIITKNDENLIEDCIKSVYDFAREIIVVDLGSTDSTVAIVKKYTNRIFGHKWANDFSEIRNLFFKWVSSDWVLYLDAYERLTPESKKNINAQLLSKKNVGYMFRITEMGQTSETEYFSMRLFKRTNEIRFKWVLHESVTDDVQKIARRDNLGIVTCFDIVIERYLYLKYFDESEMHELYIEVARHGLAIPNLENTLKIAYKIYLALSLNAIGEEEEAETEMEESLEAIRLLDPKAVYNIHIFMTPFIYYCFKYSKKEKYDEALKIIEEAAEIYNNSLTVLARYVEQLYMNKQYKKCLDHIAKIKMLLREEEYYMLEATDFSMVYKITSKLENLALQKYEASILES
jgi:glycosyltransferase involved in cell wall biosynthesis